MSCKFETINREGRPECKGLVEMNCEKCKFKTTQEEYDAKVQRAKQHWKENQMSWTYNVFLNGRHLGEFDAYKKVEQLIHKLGIEEDDELKIINEPHCIPRS